MRVPTMASVRLQLIAAVAVLSCLVDVLGFESQFMRFQELVHERQRQEAVREMQQERLAIPRQYFIEQPLDHFNAQNQGTYKQRYLVKTNYWRRPDGPVFLYIAGEWRLSEVEMHGSYNTYAKTHGALMLAVEHRFYGESINDDGYLLENLQFLSSQQALADLASLHRVIVRQYNLTERNKWISFGCSYAGSMSAWIRIKYPHLVHGSISSSAPVEADINFSRYFDVVGRSVREPAVGGSEECAAMIGEAFVIVDDMLESGNTEQLANDFRSCEPVTSDFDIRNLVLQLAFGFAGACQYSDYYGGVEYLCHRMTASSDAYRNLVNLNQGYMMTLNEDCTDYTWLGNVKDLSNVTVTKKAGFRYRPWMYQKCRQYGFFKTCDVNTHCPFSRRQTLEPMVEICNAVFGIKPDDVRRHVDFTNDYYGAVNRHTSRMIYINGRIDPWHSLSVLQNLTDSTFALVVPTTSHCSDVRLDQPTDPQGLRDARRFTSEQIGIWLSEEDSKKGYRY